MRKPRLFFKKFYLAIIMLFLYIPIVVMIAQSFNAGKSRAKWEGFSFRWYAELFQDRSIMQALQVTIAVAGIAAIIATITGTGAVQGALEAAAAAIIVPPVVLALEKIQKRK